MNAPKRIAITGASGYLGRTLVRHFESRGIEVIPMGRKGTIRFSLENGVDLGAFKNHRIDALIHCAHDFRARTWNEQENGNLRGSLALFERAANEGVKNLLFISTMSAFAGCRSLYGRVKYEIELGSKRSGVRVLRPGLIYGDVPGGMVGMLVRLARLSPILPLIGNGRQILYLIHEADLANWVEEALSLPFSAVDRPITAAHPEPYSFRELLRIFARPFRRRLFLIPTPWRMVWAAVRLLEMVLPGLGLRSDSVISLMNQDPNPCFEGGNLFAKPLRALDVRRER